MKKRIALSAVVALFAGLLAAAPASAAAGSITVPVGGGIVGGYAPVTFEGATNSEYVVTVTGATVASATPALADTDDTISIVGNTGIYPTFPTNTFQYTTGADAAVTVSMNLVASIAGTSTITVSKLTAGVPTAVYTKSLTWTSFVGASTTPSAQWSTVGSWGTGGYASALTAGEVDDFTVTVKSTDNAALTGPVARVVVTGPGTVTVISAATAETLRGRDITVPINSADSAFDVNLFGDGNSGSTTITVYAGTVMLGAKTFIFYKDLKSLTVTQQRSIAPAGKLASSLLAPLDRNLGYHYLSFVAADAALVVTGKDVDGNTFPVAAKCDGFTTAKSSDLTVMEETVNDAKALGTSVTTLGIDVRAAVNAASGKSATLTFTCSLTSEYTGLPYTVSTSAIPFTTGGTTKTTTITFDKAAYGLGQAAVITVSGKDSSGNPVHDDAQLTDGGLISNLLASGILFGTADLFAKNGKGSIDGTVFAPVAVGTWTVSGYDYAGNAISASATVTPDSATAANAAAIATLQTSVAALQTTVASLVASLTAQIKVINTALRKIAAKMKVKL